MSVLPGSHRQTAASIVIGSMMLYFGAALTPVFLLDIARHWRRGNIFSIPSVRFLYLTAYLSICCLIYYTVGDKEASTYAFLQFL